MDYGCLKIYCWKSQFLPREQFVIAQFYQSVFFSDERVSISHTHTHTHTQREIGPIQSVNTDLHELIRAEYLR